MVLCVPHISNKTESKSDTGWKQAKKCQEPVAERLGSVLLACMLCPSRDGLEELPSDLFHRAKCSLFGEV